jgi:hypothetical protein
MEMRVKAGHPVQAIQRHINFFGESFQLVGGQVAELALNFPKLAKNHGEKTSPGRVCIHAPENNHQSRAV